MPKIRVLEKQVAELIAAGEVVDRPSSVIKELVENAVDAGATVITVEIRRGGITFMRVTDNGCGIAAEDVPTAFLRHATSKVNQEDDLNSIATLGFRGEALASISAVAHVELLTRTAGAVTGVRYTCGGGEEPTLEEAGCPEGTTILVRDLFTTPPPDEVLEERFHRRQLCGGILDKLGPVPSGDFRAVHPGWQGTAAHPGGRQAFLHHLCSVWPGIFLHLDPVNYELGHVKCKATSAPPPPAAPTGVCRTFSSTGRYIRSRTAMAALEEAYKGSIMVGSSPPVCCICTFPSALWM